MTSPLIHDRGRGPEIVGTRITVYTLLPDFLDPEITEADICGRYDLAPKEVAAARSFVIENMEVVLSNYLKIDERITGENPPEFVEKMRTTRVKIKEFKEWLARRDGIGADSGNSEGDSPAAGKFPTFKQWLAERESQPIGAP